MSNYNDPEYTCPQCGSTEIYYEDVYGDGDQVYYPWQCYTCKAYGTAVFNREFVEHINVFKEVDNCE